jgi:hypothetical protein
MKSKTGELLPVRNVKLSSILVNYRCIGVQSLKGAVVCFLASAAQFACCSSHTDLYSSCGTSHWGGDTGDDTSSCPTLDWCPFNHYRTSGDINSYSATSWIHNLQTTRKFQDKKHPLSRPSCWVSGTVTYCHDCAYVF